MTDSGGQAGPGPGLAAAFGAVLDGSPAPGALWRPVLDGAGSITDLEIVRLGAGGAGRDVADDALAGASGLDVFGPDAMAPYLVAARHAVATGRGSVLETVSAATRARHKVVALPVGDLLGTLSVDIMAESAAADEVEAARGDLAIREEEYRILAENASDVVFRGTNDGVIDWVSGGLRGLTGFSPVDIIGRPFVQFLAPEDRPAVRDAQARVLGGEEQRFEARFITASGSLRWVSLLVRPVVNADGTVVARVGGLRDIDAEHAARVALVERTRELAEAQRLAGVGSWTWDRAADTGYWSEEMFRMLGFEPADVPPPTPVHRSRYDDESRERLMAASARCAEDGTPYEVPVVIVHPDGSRHHAIARGEFVGSTVLRGTLADVTASVLAGQALAASEGLYRLLAENSSDIITRTAPDGALLFVSGAVRRVLGWEPDEVVGQERDAFLFADDVPVAREAAARVAAGSSVVVRLRWRHKSGSMTWCETASRPISNHAGHFLGSVASTRDVQAQVDAEERLARRTAQLAQAQRLAHVGSFTFDVGTGEQDWSDELYRIMGLEPAGAPPSFDLQEAWFGPMVQAERRAVHERLATSEGSFESEREIALPDGRVRRLGISGEVLPDSPGGSRYIAVAVQDITDRVARQEQIAEAQRRELVGQLAGGVAHDYNNILTAVIGHLELLGADLPPGSPQRRDAEAALDAARRAAELTRRLLAYGGRQVLRREVLDLDDVVEELLPLVVSACGDMLVVGHSRIAVVPKVRVDRTVVEQALLNLALNARDAMPGGGTIQFAVDAVELADGDPRLRGAAKAGRFVRIRVTDTGSGIAPEVLPHIFEPFYSTKDLAAGAGLGLASVAGSLEQSGGLVAVETATGRGTTFSLMLPVLAEAVAPAVAEGSARAAGGGKVERPSPPGRGLRVLVVEDEPLLRTVVARMLRMDSHDAVVAGNGQEALDIVAGGAEFDLLLTDVMLPGMRGTDLAARLHEARRSMAVVTMSAYAPEQVFADGRVPVDFAFLPKPFTRQALADVIAQVTAQG